MLLSEIPDEKIRIIKTCVLYGSFLSLGLVMAIPGPTLVDLQHKAETTSKVTSYLLSGRALASVLGAFGSGLIFDRCSRQMSYGIAVFMMGLGTIGLPWWTTVAPMGGFIALAGLGVGAVLGSGSVWCLDLWGDSSPPFLQALFFFYGIGNLLAPLMSAPFVAYHDEDNSTINNGTGAPYPTDGLYVITPYVIVGSFTIIASIAILVVAFLFPKEATREALMDEELILAEKLKRPPKLVRTHKMYLILLGFSFLLVYCGMEAIFGLQLTTYVVNSDLDIGKQTGSFMPSIFWGCFVVTRGLTIMCAVKFSARTILFGSCIITTMSAILLVCGGDSEKIVLWIGVATTGVGMSATMPSILNWVETYVAITNRVASFFNVAGAIGSAIFPLIVGQYIEENPIILFYIMLGGSIMTEIIYVVIIVFIAKVMKLREAKNIVLDMQDPFSFSAMDK